MQVLNKASSAKHAPSPSPDAIKILVGNERVGEMKNCFGCGAIYRAQDFERLERCTYCGRGATSNAQKERKKRREEGYEDEPGWLEALAAAEKLKDKLVAFDRQTFAGSGTTTTSADDNKTTTRE